jgi:hypothetical protein
MGLDANLIAGAERLVERSHGRVAARAALMDDGRAGARAAGTTRFSDLPWRLRAPAP